MKVMMTLLLCVFVVGEVQADRGSRKGRRTENVTAASDSSSVSSTFTGSGSGWTRVVNPSEPRPYEGTEKECKDALDEVNDARARRGLRPFVKDELLTQAAYKAASLRARSHIRGHLPSDFDCLPPGGHATTAGCGALEPSWGWGTCCMYDGYTYCGAAWVMGSDGRRYMHVFCR